MKGRLIAGVLSAAAALLFVAASGDATTLRAVPFAEVARRADGIVVATAAGSTVRLGVTPAGRERPYTHYDLREISQIAGSVSTRNLILPVIGGSVGEHSLRVPGAPVLDTGRRYVLFLKPGERFCGLVGWTQGLFRVYRDGLGVDRVCTYDGAPVSGFADGKVLGDGPAIELGEFLAAAVGYRNTPGSAPPTTVPGAPGEEPRVVEPAEPR